jgi:dTMP kinase
MKTGLFAAFEGVDASGKATQSKILANRLTAELYSFPAYHTLAGKLIAAHLQSEWEAMYRSGRDDQYLDAMVLQSLMLTNRMELATLIQEALQKGVNVVADRYWCSGYAYGKADGLDGAYLLQIHELLPKPTIQFLLDVEPEDSIKRRPERRDRYEKQEGLMEKVAENYRGLWDTMAEKEPGKWIIINGRKPVQEVSEAIWDSLMANTR